MLMPGGRYETSPVDFQDRRSRPTSRSVQPARRKKSGAQTAADLHQNGSADDNNDAVGVTLRQSHDDMDNVVSCATLDHSQSRLSKFIDVVGKPFARKRSKSVDALLSRRQPAPEFGSPVSTDDQLSRSTGTSGNTSMTTLTQFANGQIPGMLGIRNHGNTCFMNSVIQCLSNTEFFTEYFVTDEFRTTVLAAQKAGRACAITKQLSQLLSSLWTCDYSYEVSAAFRAVVGRNAEQYQGTEQMDAQEFLQWLLDRVNEELYGTCVTNNRALHSLIYKVHVSKFDIVTSLFGAKNYALTMVC